MRFIAKYARYRHGVRTGRFMVLQDGQRQELSKDLFCKFETYIPTDEERELGLATFNFLGLPEDRDTNAPVSPRNRISGFDTVRAQEELGWTDAEREIVESALRNSFALGDEFIEVEKGPAALPWPTYDIAPPETILQIALSIGADLDEVFRYETENANREEVLTALANPTEVEEDDSVLIEA